ECELREITVRRKRELRQETAISAQELDEASSQFNVAAAVLKIAQAKVSAAEAQAAAAGADVSVAESEGAGAKDNVARLKTLLAYAAIPAPFDGTITERSVDIGAFARSAASGATTPLLMMATVDKVRLVVEVPELEAPLIRPGTPVKIGIQALGA